MVRKVKSKDTADSLRLPPQSLMAEEALLGGVMLENEALSVVTDYVREDDFYRPGNREIFKTILALARNNEPIDLVTVADHLKQRQKLDEVGGGGYLSSLVDNVHTAANLLAYARIVKNKSLLRGLIHTATDIVERSYGEVEDVDQLVDDAERSILDVARKRSQTAITPIAEIVKSSFAAIDAAYRSHTTITGVPTGFSGIDNMTCGFQRSDLIIIAGRPSMGKTSFALNIAHNAAANPDVLTNVAFFSLEMSKEQLVTRLLCSQSEINAQTIRRGLLKDADWPRLSEAAAVISELPLYIDDTAAITVMEMRAKARRLKNGKGLDMVVVDYLQLMRGDGESREREISEISRSLKAMAKELDIPVVALSQLNRSVESRIDKRPQLSDLRESGAIEQDADVIMFVYRDEVYNKETQDNVGLAEILVRKQRNGPTGVVNMRFFGEFTTFRDIDNRYDDYAGGPGSGMMGADMGGSEDDFSHFDGMIDS
ncbi:MAG: replicative DNA helicase [Deltaproteobacteria bacterium]|nr:replicative DNA helicase [Deltaproteobacteria bacterium]